MSRVNTYTKMIPCPHCRKEVPWHENPHRPFCSERCRQIDLGHWATESYRIAAKEDDASEFTYEVEKNNQSIDLKEET